MIQAGKGPRLVIVACLYNTAGAAAAAFVTRAVQFVSMMHAAPCQAKLGDRDGQSSFDHPSVQLV